MTQHGCDTELEIWSRLLLRVAEISDIVFENSWCHVYGKEKSTTAAKIKGEGAPPVVRLRTRRRRQSR